MSMSKQADHLPAKPDTSGVATPGVATPDVATPDVEALNQSLKQQLQDLLEQARLNQHILKRHQALELKLIGAVCFRDLLDTIFITLKQISELDFVSLRLLENQNNLKQILSDLEIAHDEYPCLLFATSVADFNLDGEALTKSVLSRFDAKLHGHLLPSTDRPPSSIAIVPLLRQGTLFGSLIMGSVDAERFNPNLGTDFIERMAAIISICLENVMNRERLTHIGLTDALTNVSNRRFVEQRLLEEIGRSRRQNYNIACLYLDIDFFKKINDEHGHQGGDDVLKEVAGRIKKELRSHDTVGRFGGEEFVVILVNTNQADALMVAERIRQSIAEKPFLLTMADTCSTSISIGLATLHENQHQDDISTCAEDLLWRADKALYQAKRNGRNQVCLGLV